MNERFFVSIHSHPHLDPNGNWHCTWSYRMPVHCDSACAVRANYIFSSASGNFFFRCRAHTARWSPVCSDCVGQYFPMLDFRCRYRHQMLAREEPISRPPKIMSFGRDVGYRRNAGMAGRCSGDALMSRRVFLNLSQPNWVTSIVILGENPHSIFDNVLNGH